MYMYVYALYRCTVSIHASAHQSVWLYFLIVVESIKAVTQTSLCEFGYMCTCTRNCITMWFAKHADHCVLMQNCGWIINAALLLLSGSLVLSDRSLFFCSWVPSSQAEDGCVRGTGGNTHWSLLSSGVQFGLPQWRCVYVHVYMHVYYSYTRHTCTYYDMEPL